jgi:hypothetical protein
LSFLDNGEEQVSQLHAHTSNKTNDFLKRKEIGDSPTRNAFGGGGQSKLLCLNKFSTCCCRYVGFYKGVQSAGAAVAWQVDTHKTSLLSQLIMNWGLTTISYPLLAVLVFFAVKDEDYSVSSVEDGKEKQMKMAAPSSLH